MGPRLGESWSQVWPDVQETTLNLMSPGVTQRKIRVEKDGFEL